MSGSRRPGDGFFGFGDPFAGFGGPAGLGGQGSLFSNFFGGRDPFDDPFFKSPFGSPFPSPFGSMLGSGSFGMHDGPSMGAPPAGFIEDQEPQSNKRRGPVIEEINSDDEEDGSNRDKSDNSRKHSRLEKGPYVQDPDDEAQERQSRQIQSRNEYARVNSRVMQQPQSQSFTFQSSNVSYGGVNGAYYTKSTTRRTGSDGISFEESKEADTAARKASHRISRGLHNKGHTLMRNLNSDGKVDTMQTLHNLNEDELGSFEQTWDGKARKHLPGFSQRNNFGPGSGEQSGQPSNERLALPATERPQYFSGVRPDMRGRPAYDAEPSGGSRN